MTTRRPSIIAALFDEQVSAHPDRLALVADRARLTYRELDRASDLLAARLHARGISAERVVGIALPRSEHCAIAWLAIAKVNGACLWLDPDYPAQRLTDMVEAAGPELLLTLEEHRAQVGEVAGGAELICLDEPDPDRPELPAAGPQAPEESASYIIFTSGSTGKPKGTVLTGTGTASLRETAVRGLGVGGGSRVLQFTSMSFDVAFFEMVMSLLVGGRLVVVPSEQRVADAEFWDLLRAEGVTHACLPPAFLELLPETGVPEPLTVITGADKVPTELARRWARRCRVITAYGVTEATVNSTLWDFDPAWESAVAPIGVPDPGTTAHLLDEDLQEVPDGQPGELYLAGDGLARGYLDQTALTASRFVPNPFGTGDRMYRTGDRVVRHPGGVLEFLGRMDAQIKVRGHRIEPTEVESALLGHPSVAQAVVSAQETRPGGAQLVAHVVGADGARPDARELRQHLAGLVPRYMIPSTVVVVDRLVALPNGKIDRRALPPVPEIARGAELRDILAEELGELPASGELDFVAAGGHSLSAMRLVARIREQLGWRLSVRDFFDARHVDDLVRRESDVPASAPAARGSLSPGQERLWLVEQLGDTGALYVVPWVWRVSGDLDVQALRSALRTVVARHDVLRTRYPSGDGVPVLEVLDADPDFEVRDTDDPDGAVAAAVREGFDLAERPPLRIRVLRAGEDEWVVVVCLHHIATDDWSINALAHEIGRCYQGRLLPDVALQHADHITVSTVESERFWLRALAGMPAEISLPRDRPRPEIASYRGAQLTRSWSARRLDGLQELALENVSSLYIVVHALIASVLAELGAGSDVVVGAPVSGRGDPRTYSAQGFFVNTVVLRTPLGGEQPFSRVLARVRDADLAAFSHQDVPFSTVVEQVNPRRHAGRNPLFQVMVAQQHHADVVPDLGLDARAVPVDKGTSEFDLGFAFMAGESGMTFKAEYSTDLFDEATIVDVLDRIEALADEVISGADPVIRPHHLADDEAEAPTGVPVTGSRDAVELVTRLCAEVLGEDEVTPQDDFFDLGGHSLSAMRLVAALRSRHGIDVGVSALFSHPVMADFAARIGQVEAVATAELAPAARGTTAPMSFGQEQLWLFEQLGEAFDVYAEPWIWRVTGDLDAERLRKAVLEVTDRHEVLRTRYPLVDGSPVQEVLPPGDADVEILAEPTEDLLDALTGGAFELTERPPVRVRILPVGDEWLVAWSMHHIAIDDWSIGLLATEVGAAYRGDDLPELPVQYADHAIHQRKTPKTRNRKSTETRNPISTETGDRTSTETGDRTSTETGDQISTEVPNRTSTEDGNRTSTEDGDRVSTEVLDPSSTEIGDLSSTEIRGRWGGRLVGLPAEVSLPGDRPRPEEPSYRGATETRRLTSEVRRVARENGVTTYMVLHAALAAVLAESGAGEDIAVGCPVSGREEEATHALVGFFVNTVVLRTDLTGEPTFTDLLRRVRDADLDAFAHADVPFARVVEAVNPPRHPSRNPLFQVMLAQQHHSDAVPRLGETISTELVRMPVRTAQFDLSIGFSDTPEGISLNVEYSTDLFERDTALGFIHRFEALLDRVAAGEDPVIRPTRRDPEVRADTSAPLAGGDVALIVRLFAEILDAPDAAAGDDFFDLGGHSLTAIKLINRIEEATGTRIPVRALLKARTAEAVAAVVEEKAGRA